MRPPLRTKSVGTKVTDVEYAALETRARASSLTLSEWVRDVLLASSPEVGAEVGDRVLLAELLALRTVLMNQTVDVGLRLLAWPPSFKSFEAHPGHWL
jgi:hypothetical protein